MNDSVFEWRDYFWHKNVSIVRLHNDAGYTISLPFDFWPARFRYEFDAIEQRTIIKEKNCPHDKSTAGAVPALRR